MNPLQKERLKRKEKALKLRAKGLTCRAIAKLLGYKSASSIHHLLK